MRRLILTGNVYVHRQIAATGSMDLRGRVLRVGAVPEKIGHCREAGVGLFVIPSSHLTVSTACVDCM